jgi:anaerobic ribonucleoside-triphosphate reductase activating protein
MNYATIKWYDIANGEGVRISLFVSGCTHRCKNCFNQVAWDFAYGEPFDEAVQQKILKELGSSYIAGLSLLGGEPFEPSNQAGLLPFLRKWRERFPGKNVWCYTGCVLERDLLASSRWRTGYTDEMLSMIDVLVDGPFVETLKDISLKFRGSSNQRILDLSGGAHAAKVIPDGAI